MLNGQIKESVTIQVTAASNTLSPQHVGIASIGKLHIRPDDLIQDDAASTGTLTYTIDQLDLDAEGGNNDQVRISFKITTDSGNIQTSLSNKSGWLSPKGTALSSVGQFIRMEFASLHIDLNGKPDSGEGSFTAFSAVQLGKWEERDDNAKLNFKRIVWSEGNDYETFSIRPSNYWVLRYDNKASGQWRPLSWNFSLDVKTKGTVHNTPNTHPTLAAQEPAKHKNPGSLISIGGISIILD